MREVSLNGVVGWVRFSSAARAVLVVLSLVMVATPVLATGGVTFVDVATAENVGLTYSRVPSSTIAVFDQLTQLPILTFNELPLSPNKPHGAPGVAMLDYDGDGDLDLYVTNNLAFDPRALPNGGRPCPYREIQVACGPIGFDPQPDRLFQNDGTGRFRDVSEAAGLHAVAPQFGLGVKMTDLDADGRLDLYVANDSGPNFFFRNLGRAEDAAPNDPVRFEEIAFLNGLATSSDGRYQAGMGIDSADLDGDGRIDVFVTNFAHDHNTLYRNLGDGLFRDDSHPSGLGGPSRLSMAWGTRFFDLNHDGLLDLYVANGHLYPEVDAGGVESFAQPDHLYLNQGAGRFEEVSSRIERGSARVSRGLATGDHDGDGALDVVVVEMGSAPTVLRNEGAEGGFVIVDPRVLGATVTATVGTTTHYREIARGGSYLSSSAPEAHIGLGDATRVDTVAIQWPSGKAVALRGLPANVRYVVREP